MNFQEAKQLMEQGKKVACRHWNSDIYDEPSFLVLIRGREIEASYEPMVTHLGKGTKMKVHDHIDAVYLPTPGFEGIRIKVGYSIRSYDIGATDWYEVK